MRIFSLLVTVATATVSATTPQTNQSSSAPHPIDRSREVVTEAGTPVDIATHNRNSSGLFFCGKEVCDKRPELIFGFAPPYPQQLAKSRVTGHATIVFTVDEQGGVVDPYVESGTRLEFAEASLRAIQTWRFKPASLRGEAFRVTMRQQFPFDLR